MNVCSVFYTEINPHCIVMCSVYGFVYRKKDGDLTGSAKSKMAVTTPEVTIVAFSNDMLTATPICFSNQMQLTIMRYALNRSAKS